MKTQLTQKMYNAALLFLWSYHSPYEQIKEGTMRSGRSSARRAITVFQKGKGSAFASRLKDIQSLGRNQERSFLTGTAHIENKGWKRGRVLQGGYPTIPGPSPRLI